MLFYKLFETYKNLKFPRGHSPNFMANIFTLHMHVIGNRAVIYTSMDIYNEIYILSRNLSFTTNQICWDNEK